ncbi:hypothetical protein PR048_006460, partial [Dryococelus australis]
MELIDIQCNTFNKVGIPKFYSYLLSQCSEMCQFAAGILPMFRSTYLCEQLTPQHLSSILKTASSQNMVVDIETLVSKKRCQIS